MRYLLDTHTLLWAVDAPEKLSARAMAIVRGEDTQVFISIATPWELAIKANKGGLDVEELLMDFERAVLGAGYAILETTVSQVIGAGKLPLHHRDPFDRLMIAQSLERQIPIVSRDNVFDLYGVRRIWN